jgi:CBS domain-containing protein
VALSFGLNPDLRINPVAGRVKEAMAAIGTKKDMYGVDLTQTIVLSGLNPRIKDERYWNGVRLLKESIKKNGWYPDKPLAGYAIKKDGKDVIVVVEGGRRRDAGLMLLEEMKLENPEFAKMFRAPMVTKKAGTSELDLQYGLAQGNNAEPFRPYELAVLVKRLYITFDQTEKQILEGLVGIVSASHLPKLLMIASAPQEIADAVVAETLSVTEAYDLMVKHGDKSVDVLKQAGETSKAAGSKKIMKKHMPGVKFEKALVKESRHLFDMAVQVRADEGFAGLSEATRAVLDDMVREINELKSKCDEDDTKMNQQFLGEEASAAGQDANEGSGADNDESHSGRQVA